MYFIAIYRRGSAWVDGKSFFEHPVDDHIKYMDHLFEKDVLVTGGPFGDNTGGIAIIKADNEQEAESILLDDPAVKNKIIHIDEIHPWNAAFL